MFLLLFYDKNLSFAKFFRGAPLEIESQLRACLIESRQNTAIVEGRITRKNLVHFRKNLKQKSYRKIEKSYKNPKNLSTILNNF